MANDIMCLLCAAAKITTRRMFVRLPASNVARLALRRRGDNGGAGAE